MEENIEVEISVLKGDKLFNENTPFIINLSSPELDSDTKRSHTDLICVIDSSMSMRGTKINEVKKSLKILIDLMDQNDRLALITFNKSATNYFDLQYLTDKNKIILKNKIDLIENNRGTNILSGLKNAVDIIKEEQKQNNKKRVSSVILLSDGKDTYRNDTQLADSLKNMTKGFGLSFTLHTFGYGYKYDEKILKKLACLRDGSFYFVENYKKVSEYFACVLGGCISVISNKGELNVKLLKNSCKIVKAFGGESLYEYKLEDDTFETNMLQFLCGKEYSFVLEIKIDEKDVKIGEELLNIDFNYEDIVSQKKKNKNYKYKYELQSIDYMKANEEYIRSQVYYVLDKVIQLFEKGEKDEAKKILDDIKDWLEEKYKGENTNFLINVYKAYNIFKNDTSLVNTSIKFISSEIRQNQLKKQGCNMVFCNSVQMSLVKSISKHPFHNSMQFVKNDLTKSIVFK